MVVEELGRPQAHPLDGASAATSTGHPTMTLTQAAKQRACDLVNEIRGNHFMRPEGIDWSSGICMIALAQLCQDISDAVEGAFKPGEFYDIPPAAMEKLARFIIRKPDLLVDALKEVGINNPRSMAKMVRDYVDGQGSVLEIIKRAPSDALMQEGQSDECA
jgi:hypothetical protein